MPIYEYECGACGHTLDALQKVSDALLRKCPECERRKLKRLVSAPKFRLKGEGWYETDFKKGNKRNLAERDDDKSAAKPDEGKAGGKEAASDGGKKKESAKAESAAAPKTKSKPKASGGPAP